MTRQAMKHGIELTKSLDSLGEHRKSLEYMKKLIVKNMYDSKTCCFCVKGYGLASNENVSVDVSPQFAYLAIDEELKDIEKRIKTLTEEFSNL